MAYAQVRAIRPLCAAKVIFAGARTSQVLGSREGMSHLGGGKMSGRAFAAASRVELAGSHILGTVESDDCECVRVRWDDGKIGFLKYDRTVAFNAYRLIRLKSPPLSHAGGGR